MTTIREYYEIDPGYLESQVLGAHGYFVAGVECEIEGLRDIKERALSNNGIRIESEGSLRNGGREFLLPPRRTPDCLALFEQLHSKWLLYSEEAFHPRTSTHVHVNVQTSTMEQVQSLLYLYSIFEPLAFAFVGDERKNNIHCVPLSMTYMPQQYGKTFDVTVDGWHKYTAFNLLPLKDLGTVEFRHLEGTGDSKRFAAWLGFLETLWIQAHSLKRFTVDQLLSLTFLEETYKKLLTPEFLRNCKNSPEFNLEDNLLDIKLIYI